MCSYLSPLYGKGEMERGGGWGENSAKQTRFQGGLNREGSKGWVRGHGADWQEQNEDDRTCTWPFHFHPALRTVSFSAEHLRPGLVWLHHVAHCASQSFTQNQACSRHSANIKAVDPVNEENNCGVERCGLNSKVSRFTGISGSHIAQLVFS